MAYIISTHMARKRRVLNARRSISALEKRLNVLEQQVQELKKAQSSELLHELIPGPVKPRRGRKPKIQLHFLSDRDAIVHALEACWPELQPLLLRPQEPEGIRERLGLLAKSLHQRGDERLNHLLRQDVFPQMLEFLKSDRFRGDPRRLANALAGVPNVRWWRSLRVCEAHPCWSRIGERALQDYLRRKHRRLFRDLLDCGDDLVCIASALKRYRSKDPEFLFLQRNAVLTLELMKALPIL